MFKLAYKDMLIEYNYDAEDNHYKGQVVGIEEHIQHTSPSLTEMKKHLFSEIDSLLTFNHRNGF